MVGRTRWASDALGSINDKKSCARLGAGAMRRIAKIRDLIADTRPQDECPAILEFRDQLAFQHQQHMAAVAPVIGHVAGRVVHHAHAEISD